jgi:DNA-binding MarR family transcriptional regulator
MFKDANDISHKKHKSKNSSPTIFKVFLHLLTHIDKDNLVIISQKNLASEFGCTQSAISKALKNLVEMDFCKKMRQRRSLYQLNPVYAIATRTENQDALIEQYKQEASEARQELLMFKRILKEEIKKGVKSELMKATSKPSLRLVKE